MLQIQGSSQNLLAYSCRNVFESGFYKNYFEIVKNKVTEIGLNSLLLKTESHREFLTQLRESIDQPEVRALSTWLFTEVDFEKAWWDVLEAYMPSLKDREELSLDLVHDIHCHLRCHPQLSDTKDSDETDFHLLGNLPSRLWSFDNIKEDVRYTTQFVRTPCVAFLKDFKCALQPEFEAFVKDCEAKNKKILYVNLMNFKAALGIEAFLTNGLHRYAHQASKSLTVISMERDSKLSNDVAILKEQILSSCKWSTNKDIGPWVAQCRQILDDVHEHYFNNCKVLEENLPHAFKEIALLILLDEFITLETPDFCLITCHVGSDRSPAFYQGLRLLHLKRKDLTKEDYQNLLGPLFANAILLRNRAPHAYTTSIFQMGADILMSRPLLQINLKEFDHSS